MTKLQTINDLVDVVAAALSPKGRTTLDALATAKLRSSIRNVEVERARSVIVVTMKDGRTFELEARQL